MANSQPRFNAIRFLFVGIHQRFGVFATFGRFRRFKNRIRNVCAALACDVLLATTTRERTKRYNFCVQCEGREFEHMLK